MKLPRWAGFVFAVAILIGAYWWWLQTLPVATQAPPQVASLLEVYSIEGEAVVKRFPSGLVEILERSDKLEAFDAIRTLGDSHLVLNLSGSTDRLEVGPESELTVTGRVEDPSFSFFRGEVLFSWHGDNVERRVETGALELRSANSDFLVRSSDKAGTTIEVYRGKLSAKAGAKTSQAEKDEVIEYKGRNLSRKKFDFLVVTPMTHDRVYYNGDESFKTRFAWSGLPDSARVRLYLGDHPSALKPFETESTGKKNEFAAVIPVGVSYWRFKATVGKKSLESPIYKIFGVTEQPVQLLEPIGPVSAQSRERTGGLYFRWTNPSRLERLLLEVSRDESFERPILRQPLVDADSQILPLADQGVFYWRVNGFRHDSSELVTSVAQKFEVVPDLVEPEILFPEPSAQLALNALKNGETFAVWKASGLAQYEIEIKSTGETQKFLSSTNRFQLPLLKKGHYKLQIKVAGSKQAAEREFDVVEAPLLGWKMVSETDPLTTEKLQWEEGPKGTSVYRVRLWSLFPVQESSAPFHEYVISQRNWIFDLPEDGLYVAVVQALGTDTKLLAESKSLVFRPKK